MQKKKKTYLNKATALLLFFLFIFSCTTKQIPEKKELLKLGGWVMEMDLNGEVLPFSFELNKTNSTWGMAIINDQEKILVSDVVVKNDSLIAKLPVFESEFKLAIKDPENMVGLWLNYYKGPNYKINSVAKFFTRGWFRERPIKNVVQINPKYEVVFSKNTDSSYAAIGLFNQKENRLTGTFATETGDFRHLEGNVYGDSIFLSTFDGSHAFLFKGVSKGDSIMGNFWSGTHWKESWVAKPNDDFKLRNPDSLTFIKPEYDGINFSFENESGQIVSLSDETYKNKVVIVQVMGTWCPNCLDETNYFTELYRAYNSEGLEIVAIAFERTRTKEKGLNNIKRLKDRTGADYEILLGGSSSKDKAAEKLPMLNHVMSYPTAIFIDKKGNVRKIHTGFYGPGTGNLFLDYKKETELFIESLLNE